MGGRVVCPFRFCELVGLLAVVCVCFCCGYFVFRLVGLSGCFCRLHSKRCERLMRVSDWMVLMVLTHSFPYCRNSWRFYV